MMMSSALWNEVMLSITGEPDGCSLYSHGDGCPNSANAVPLAASAIPATANPSNRRPIRPFDIFMPFALPSKIIPNALRREGEQCRTIRLLPYGRPWAHPQGIARPDRWNAEIQPLKP